MRILILVLMCLLNTEAILGQLTVYPYPNGQIRSTGSYDYDSANLLIKRVGEWEYYYEDGSIRSKGTFIDGQKAGEWIYYHPNGQVQSKGEYCIDATHTAAKLAASIRTTQRRLDSMMSLNPLTQQSIESEDDTRPFSDLSDSTDFEDFSGFEEMYTQTESSSSESPWVFSTTVSIDGEDWILPDIEKKCGIWEYFDESGGIVEKGDHP